MCPNTNTIIKILYNYMLLLLYCLLIIFYISIKKICCSVDSLLLTWNIQPLLLLLMMKRLLKISCAKSHAKNRHNVGALEKNMCWRVSKAWSRKMQQETRVKPCFLKLSFVAMDLWRSLQTMSDLVGGTNSCYIILVQLRITNDTGHENIFRL